MNNKNFDFIIIGAGIVGSMIARSLSKYKAEVLLIEKEADIGTGASCANTAIIHAGHDPAPGSLKAKLNVTGNKMWTEISDNLHIPLHRTGSYVVAIGEQEFQKLEHLYENGKKNGVPDIEIVGRDYMLKREPKLNPDVSGAFYSPTGGVIDPFKATLAVCENAVRNGVTLVTEAEFLDFISHDGEIKGVKTIKGDFMGRWVINCAGCNSDEVMHRAGVRPEFQIIPRRGEYMIFDPSKITLDSVYFPVPSKETKGILVSISTHGNVMIGPNADKIDDKEDKSSTRNGLDYVFNNAKKMFPSLDLRHVISQYCGVRSTGNNSDRSFIIEIPDKVKGLVNLGGIDSPGFASAPAIAEHVVELLKDAGEIFEAKADWMSQNPEQIVFRKLSHEQRAAIVSKDPAYGNIVCRCENITEGEIRDAIRSVVPARTYDAIKRRTWLGTGRCQGGFDYPKVIEILSRELNVPITSISKKGKGSEFLHRTTKDL